MDETKAGSEVEKKVSLFEQEIARLPSDMKEKFLSKEKIFKEFAEIVNKKSMGKSMGFYINPKVEVKDNVPIPDFDNLSVNFLLDDFEKPISFFDPKILLGEDFNKYLTEEKKKDEYGQEYFEYSFKKDKNVKFFGSSITMLREDCFDSIYDDLKKLGSSFIYEDPRGFISALKTIDIHRNMLLQKFEKYVVVYAGAGSWLRGEKSNDFDVFVVIDDTDVKKMPRMQVKDQLTKIIWQMSREVAALTGIQIHIQVYLLTDFWDALKDAHPVMFTFLRDGVPFYDRGIYSAWKELLKLGKIRPSAEAIDMHMNAGTQLLERAKKVFLDVAVNDIYYAVLNPSQAILMLKGYNPTTPKETVRMFKEVLLAKEKSVSAKDVEILESTVKMFKDIEHDKDFKLTGKDLDKKIKDSEDFLKNIKKMFEQITEEKTKDSILSSYNELLNQIKTLPTFSNIPEKSLFEKFEKDYIKEGKVPDFVKSSFSSIKKAMEDYKKGKITTTEVNKVLKDIRNILSEIKELRDSSLINAVNSKKILLKYDDSKISELFSYDSSVYLSDISSEKIYEFLEGKFKLSKVKREELSDSNQFKSVNLSGELFEEIKKTLKTKTLYIH